MEPQVKDVFDSYPEDARVLLTEIRQLIFDVAEDENIAEIQETLKWGEPAYLSKSGSTLRIDWKAQRPEQVSLFLNCNTKLVQTFKEAYPGTFQFVGNRELALPMSESIPMIELRSCISLCLR
ncbi:MAG: hypothetical protein ACI9FD_004620 [Gammaproteobacteria bacterium]|jgi:hypothetical protein